jgi:hypothetical protein
MLGGKHLLRLKEVRSMASGCGSSKKSTCGTEKKKEKKPC